jgi:cobalt-zinc-cadmium efflux system membrane fusion protein
MMKTTTWIALLCMLLAVGAFAQEPAHDDHAGHDHAEVAESPADDHSDHEGEHVDEVLMTPAERAEFGITTAQAGPGVIVTRVKLPGEIHPNDDRLAHLVPRYEGIVTEVHVHEGDKVTKGQTLAVIESNETLVPYPLKTMIDGTVISKHITLGEAAKPDAAPFVVADLSTVWVSLSIYQRDLDVIRTGERVWVHADDHHAPAEGEITYVTPIVRESTRTASARVVLDNAAGRWRPGMFVVGEVEVARDEVAVAVPRTALLTVEGSTAVFVADRDGDGFLVRPVTVGATDAAMAEITAGLAPGETYVAQGGFTLKAELEKASFGHGHAH